ncbi:hypothetical protein TSOC_013934 [Tetrabaena socialis]|uniref:Uncharacterized protein n=1 Tax=Tetrabaena socialis TaxID=47790 RepID=A0A2J7ZJ08_9CHLO|nr:hypothetical protein TSOC_013934 [Tetrabaena socialis]|eukprot:PNH00253.1 hypothetical protein TSOC_013934 [Tetrabaena socialis]
MSRTLALCLVFVGLLCPASVAGVDPGQGATPANSTIELAEIAVDARGTLVGELGHLAELAAGRNGGAPSSSTSSNASSSAGSVGGGAADPAGPWGGQPGLQDVSLLLAQDLVQRMSAEWQQGVLQGAAATAAGGDPAAAVSPGADGQAAANSAAVEGGMADGTAGTPDGQAGGRLGRALAQALAPTMVVVLLPVMQVVVMQLALVLMAAVTVLQLRTVPLPPNQYANAFRLIFGNFFDLVGGARRYIATLAAEARALLLNLNWIRDLAYLVDAPFDNLLRALLRTAVNDYCTPEATIPSQLLLGEYRGPTFTLALTPASCPVAVDEETGRRSLDWAACVPARLVITITPGESRVLGLRHLRGKSCKYTRRFGTDATFKYAGGTSSYTFRASARQLDILPVLNQFFLRGQFSPFTADNLVTANITGGPVLQNSDVSAPAPGNGSDTAVVLRSAADAARVGSRGGGLALIQGDDPERYVARASGQGNGSGPLVMAQPPRRDGAAEGQLSPPAPDSELVPPSLGEEVAPYNRRSPSPVMVEATEHGSGGREPGSATKLAAASGWKCCAPAVGLSPPPPADEEVVTYNRRGLHSNPSVAPGADPEDDEEEDDVLIPQGEQSYTDLLLAAFDEAVGLAGDGWG